MVSYKRIKNGNKNVNQMNCSRFHNDFLANKTLNIFSRNVYFAGRYFKHEFLPVL